MKNAILVYDPIHNIVNIGDYIQSIAARQFCSNVPVYLNREKLNEYKGDKVKLIMNGWYMHFPENWPPSEDIVPLPVAIHINSTTYNKMLSQKGLQWFKQHEPIGCRDRYTEQKLKDNGIKAYFSGCMTLTLGESYKKEKPSDKVYFVDVYFYKNKRSFTFMSRLFAVLITNMSKINKLKRRMYRKGGFLKNVFNAAAFYLQYKNTFDEGVLMSAEYIEHEYAADFSHDYYFEEADNLLKKYANAKLVVTSRIHCALPCTGFETPVIYVQDKSQGVDSSCRLDGLLELFNILDITNGMVENKTGFDVNNPPIKQTYKRLKESLMKECKEFIENVSSISKCNCIR